MDTSNDSVRLFVLDRSVEDNQIDLDLFFTDAEIDNARALAVSHYNDSPPYSHNIQLTDENKNSLPGSSMFLHGIAYFLYLSKLMKLQKEDLDYNAGGMNVDLIKRRIAHIKENLALLKQEFLTLLTNTKVHINYNSAFGQVG